MNAMGSRHVEAFRLGSTAQVRELTTEELADVSGGAPVLLAIVVVAIVVATAVDRIADASESEDTGEDGDD